MAYNRNIEIYKIKVDFVIPLAESPILDANCDIGDFVFIIDDEVWIRHWRTAKDAADDNHENRFSKANCNIQFVRANKGLFEKINNLY